jgi:16S rRNA (guanine527-N7)-methyltransferase
VRAEPNGQEPRFANEVRRLTRYRDLLLEWNQRFNLTAMKSAAEIDRWLIGDALRMLPAIDELIEEPTARLIDVGTGAGFPGLVLKIARPYLRVTLLDATNKKVAFLRTVIDDLGLEHVEAVHGRAEELARDPDHRGIYDLATARAVSSTPALLELCMPFVRVGGHGLFPKSTNIDEELATAIRVAPTLGARFARNEVLPATATAPVTRLLIFAKIGRTPTQYPRRSGLPAHEPLGRTEP